MNGTAEQMTGVRWTTRAVVRVYRASRGRLFGSDHGLPVLLLTTVDRDTGAPCTMPLVFVREADRFLVAGVGEGGDSDRCWPENLLRDPSARVELGSDAWEVRAVPVTGGVFVLEPVS